MEDLPLIPSHSSERSIALAVTILSKEASEGEDGNNIYSAFELSVNTFHNIGRSETALHIGRTIYNGKAFFYVFFKLICQLVLFIRSENK